MFNFLTSIFQSPETSSETENQQWLEIELTTDVIDRYKAGRSVIINHYGERLRNFRIAETSEDLDLGPVWTLEFIALTSESEVYALADQLTLDVVLIEPVG